VHSLFDLLAELLGHAAQQKASKQAAAAGELEVDAIWG
jgi:hypothetical protein